MINIVVYLNHDLRLRPWDIYKTPICMYVCLSVTTLCWNLMALNRSTHVVDHTRVLLTTLKEENTAVFPYKKCILVVQIALWLGFHWIINTK